MQQENVPRGSVGFSPLAYAITVFISAFLLFQVQPLLSKFILPWFGGTPAVWTSAMLFFQIVLFLGYLYAHLTSVHLAPRSRLYLHLVVLAVALGSVAINRLIPPTSLRPTGADNEWPLLQVLMLLGATVGLPYFALSSTGPLLQKWFSESFEKSPYRLFALSNFGSLLALISYPFFFEANWGIVSQAAMWSVGFAAFTLCCGYCAWRTYSLSSQRLSAVSITSTSSRSKSPGSVGEIQPSGIIEGPPSPFEMVKWIVLPTLACIVFLAVTNEVCQNIATVPLLWIVPLALYLLSFIVAFDQPKWYSRSLYTMVGLGLLFFLSNYSEFVYLASDIINGMLGRSGANEILLSKLWWLEAGVYFSALFCMLVVCHGELAKSKPGPGYLTRFYLTISLGGALGGILVNLIAPYVFKTFFELTLAFLCCALLCVVILYSIIAQKRSPICFGLFGLGTLLAIGTFFYLIGHALPDQDSDNANVLYEARNFYGVLSVDRLDRNTPEEVFAFYSGHIQHGMQYADPMKRHLPLTYYGQGSGCEIGIRYVQQKHAQCNMGAIGLGVGTVAAYARTEDRIRFYEINPQVIEVAKNTQWFHYLSDCRGKVDTVLGDARLQLERELKSGENQQFDLLILDAFSGDAVPTHLLTDEAIGIYSEHLKPDGLLVIHITNTHLDLFPVTEQLAQKHGYGYRRMYRKETDTLSRNYYILLSKDPQFLEQVADEIEDLPEYLKRPRSVPLWTDEYTNLTRLLR